MDCPPKIDHDIHIDLFQLGAGVARADGLGSKAESRSSSAMVFSDNILLVIWMIHIPVGYHTHHLDDNPFGYHTHHLDDNPVGYYKQDQYSTAARLASISDDLVQLPTGLHVEGHSAFKILHRHILVNNPGHSG